MTWVRAFFTRSTGKPTAFTGRAVPETVARRLHAGEAVEPRFRVERVLDGVTYQAYTGWNGGDARRAWEAYSESDLAGVFTFYDGDDIRGAFNR